MKTNFDKFPGCSWLFLAFRGNLAANKIAANFPLTFEAPIVLVRRNYEQYFAVDTSELQTQESSLFLKVQCEILRENLLYLLQQSVVHVLL